MVANRSLNKVTDFFLQITCLETRNVYKGNRTNIIKQYIFASLRSEVEKQKIGQRKVDSRAGCPSKTFGFAKYISN